jgi:hypothetical protein
MLQVFGSVTLLYIAMLVGLELEKSGRILHVSVTFPFLVYFIWWVEKKVRKIRELEKKQQVSN